ncbi:MAG: hypothetical protein HPY44_14440 [Armatimonadetes bacterium]|nr:hypothetical protein [Armatimonadota bacterium]
MAALPSHFSRRSASKQAMVQVALPLLLVAFALSAGVAQEDQVSAAVAAADQAAGAYDYEAALEHLETALQAGAADALKAAIEQRRTLYEHFLGMSALIQAAQDDPERLVGQVTTRGGQQLTGYIRLVELGVSPDARIGERISDLGRFAIDAGADQPVIVTARDIAELTVEWTQPAENAVPSYWTLGKMRAVLQSGAVVEGAPTWALGLSAIAVRALDADEDALVEAYPSFGRAFDPANLISQVTIIGAPTQSGAQERP